MTYHSKEAASFNSKAMSAIFNVVSIEEFKRISNVEIAHTVWNILETVHEGIKAVKINKLQQLTSRFESIRMFDDDTFDKFFAKLNDIANSAFLIWMKFMINLRLLGRFLDH